MSRAYVNAINNHLPAQNTLIPFRGASVHCTVAGNLAKTRLAHQFVNGRAVPIEAVYEFPLPLDAVLLQLTITVGERRLTGVVKGRSRAETDYDDAVTEGNAAFLLRELRTGLHQINLGNLLPGEAVTVALDYAEILTPVDDRLRYRLPAVVSPHYGNPADSGLQPRDVPETSLLAEYPLTVEVVICDGEGLNAPVQSPSHPITTQCRQADLIVQLAPGLGPTAMDRDFILLIPQPPRNTLTLWREKVGGRVSLLGILSTAAPLALPDPAPLHLTVLVDCSGSMAGDAIVQARQALRVMLDRLNDGDQLMVLCFGSHVQPWSNQPAVIGPSTRSQLQARAQQLNADLGGTEIARAIDQALRVTPVGGSILLITDGESHVADEKVGQYTASGRRFFTVGVGSSVSEWLVSKLASDSRGYCELVTPNEDMHTRIVQQLHRIRQPQVPVQVSWGVHPPVRVRVPAQVFLGESVLFSATFADDGAETVAIALGHGTAFQMTATASDPPSPLAGDLHRIVAWHQLPLVEEREKEAYSVAHQLLNRWTALVAVLARPAEQTTDGLPQWVKVPQMLTAGWGGQGSVRSRACIVECRSFADDTGPSMGSGGGDLDYLDVPAFLRRQEPEDSDAIPISPTSLSRQTQQVREVMPGELLALMIPRPSRWPFGWFGFGKPESLAVELNRTLAANRLRLPPAVRQLIETWVAHYGIGMSLEDQRELEAWVLIQCLLEILAEPSDRRYRQLRRRLHPLRLETKECQSLQREVSAGLSGTDIHHWSVSAIAG